MKRQEVEESIRRAHENETWRMQDGKKAMRRRRQVQERREGRRRREGEHTRRR